MKLLKKLWNDEAGFIVSTELILLVTIAVFGLIVGMASVRDAVTSELSDVAGALQDVNQSYFYNGIAGHSAVVVGSDFNDNRDFCDEVEDGVATGAIDNCITVDGAPQNETGAIVDAVNP